MDTNSQAAENKYFDLGSAFYDAILSRNVDVTAELNPAELELYEKITKLVEESESLSLLVPVLPQQLMKFLEEVKKENTDFDKICAIVKGDIALAGETIRIANSPIYRRAAGEIQSINRAVATLGLQGVSDIAAALLIRQILDVESNRFKQFGEVLWNHCLECAEACRLLSKDVDDSFTCYLMGLVHDVGKVAMFTCFCDHLDEYGSEEIDECKVFKIVMTEHSTWLSAHIAKEWQLPNAIILALYEFDAMTLMSYLDYDKKGKSALAILLEQANSCSEIYTLINSGIIKSETGIELLRGLDIEKSSIEKILQRYELLDAADEPVR
ncbi:MAG: HD-like signal output (HDOD) protein [Pseudohongiellaceae bacterium]|jgi:HD-like signal output (HDOD) protein